MQMLLVCPYRTWRCVKCLSLIELRYNLCDGNLVQYLGTLSCFFLLLSQYINFYVLFMQHLTTRDLLRTFVNESLFTRNSTKGKAPDNDFELEQITQLSSDDMFPQYIKKKKNKQAKQKNCCSLSQLKKTRSSTIRCVVWKCVHLPSISQCFSPLVQQRPGCSARPEVILRPSYSMLTFVVFLWCEPQGAQQGACLCLTSIYENIS